MERYKNLGGNSNVFAFQINSDSIDVQFQDGSVYSYTYQSAGSHNIEHMKTLAVAGKGLNSFIMRHVKTAYASRRR